jgi:hypothetical protein
MVWDYKKKQVQNINKMMIAYFIISKEQKNNVSVDSVYIKKTTHDFL